MLIIPVLVRMRQQGHEFNSTLGSSIDPCVTKQTNNKIKFGIIINLLKLMEIKKIIFTSDVSAGLLKD